MTSPGPVETLPTLDAGVIRMRPWRADDAAALTDAIQDPAIVRWLDIPLPYTRDDATRFIAATPERWEARTAAHFAIVDPASDRLLGYLGVLDVADGMRIVEIAYWVAAPARGRGVAGRALYCAVAWIRETLAPDRIELGMLAGNVASARVAMRNGFVLRETLAGAGTLDGRPADEEIYEWRPEAGAATDTMPA